MKAMVLNKLCNMAENPEPLLLQEVARPVVTDNQILVRVTTCGVCHTELDEIEGRAPPPSLPVIPGHQVVGVVDDIGIGSSRFRIGDRVGIAWIASACGKCRLCKNGNENLCNEFKATGRDCNGGYAEYMSVAEDFAYRIPDDFSDVEAAPLLCAGAIGYRSMRLARLKPDDKLGLTGFGASGHLVLKMVRYLYPDVDVYVFARSEKERHFALELGAVWAGDTADVAPEQLDGIIDTTPMWKPIVEALKNLAPAGRLVINAIRKEESDKNYLSNLDYPQHLWLEKEIKSVANITRHDVESFLNLAAEMQLKPEVETYSLEEANQALFELKNRCIRGAKVLVVGETRV